MENNMINTINTIVTKQFNRPIPIGYLYITVFLVGCFGVGLYQGFNEVCRCL